MGDKKRKIKELFNNGYDTEEILWLLEGHENMSALEFVCKCILNVEPENFESVFEIQKIPEEIVTTKTISCCQKGNE